MGERSGPHQRELRRHKLTRLKELDRHAIDFDDSPALSAESDGSRELFAAEYLHGLLLHGL